MSEFAENIKFVEGNGKHSWKRLNAEGGSEHVSAQFDSLEEAQADARLNINGVHAPEEVPADAPAEAEAPVEAPVVAEPASEESAPVDAPEAVPEA